MNSSATSIPTKVVRVTAATPPTRPALPRTVHVEHCMGTAFSIDIRDPGTWTAAIDAVVVQLAGEAAPGRPWRVGISDPADRTRLLTVVTGRNLAVATSGTAERGQHILNPHTGQPAAGLASVTVVGRHLTRADGYATAAFARGEEALSWLESMPGHEAMVVDGSAGVHETSGFGDVGQR